MDQRRAAAALLALAACFACSTAAPTASNQTALDLFEAPVDGCYYNFQHYGEGDRIMTNEPCLNCTCHNRMLMCYLRVCPFTKPIGQDCTVEKRADQCCPIVTCPDVPVDLLTSTSTSSPAEYGATGLGKLDKYGCSINGKYFPEGSKVPPTPNKPCEHCYCIHNMTTCVMQECTLHVDGCTPIYHKDVCCPIRYSCDHPEDEVPLLDDLTTTVRPTPGFLLTTTTMVPTTQVTQDCVHDDKIFADGALIKTEKACEHCYCMKGDIVCVVQECGTPMENEGKNCTSLPPKHGQCCPDTYICEGDEIPTTGFYEESTTLSPPRRVEGSGYRNEPDEAYTDMPTMGDIGVEGSGEEPLITTVMSTESFEDMPKETIHDIHKFATTIDTDIVYTDRVTTELHDQDKEYVTTPSVSVTEQDKISETTYDSSSMATHPTSAATLHDERTTKGYDSQDLTLVQQTTTETLEFKTTEVPVISTEPPKDSEPELTTKSVSETSNVDMTPTDEEFIIATKLPEKSESIDYNLEKEITTTETSMQEEFTSGQMSETTMIPVSEYTAPSQATSVQESTTVNIQENEIIEEHLPARIPGEGDCLLDGVTFKNNTSVPTTSKCQSNCRCLSSIIKCDPVICTPPLEYMENMNDCHPIFDSPDSCCPTYVCSTKETIAPESHSQMSGTETPKPEIECSGDECTLNKESVISECSDASCKNDQSIPTEPNTCVDGNCQVIQEQHPVEVPELCDKEAGCQVPVIKPCNGEDCKTTQQQYESEQKDKIDQQIEPCNDENGCQVSPVKPLPSCQGDECTKEVPAAEQNEKEIQDKIELCDSKDGCEKQKDEQQGDTCNEESCRRKEHGELGGSCHGSDCKIEETTASTEMNKIAAEEAQVTQALDKVDDDHQTYDFTTSISQTTLSPKDDHTFEAIVTDKLTTLSSINEESEKEIDVTTREDFDKTRLTTESSISLSDYTTSNILDAVTTKQHTTEVTRPEVSTVTEFVSKETDTSLEHTTEKQNIYDENADKITTIDNMGITTEKVIKEDDLSYTTESNRITTSIQEELISSELPVPTDDKSLTDQSLSTAEPSHEDQQPTTHVLEDITTKPSSASKLEDNVAPENPELEVTTLYQYPTEEHQATKLTQVGTEIKATTPVMSSSDLSTPEVLIADEMTKLPEYMVTDTVPTEIQKDTESVDVEMTTAREEILPTLTTQHIINEFSTETPITSHKEIESTIPTDIEISTEMNIEDSEKHHPQDTMSTETPESLVEIKEQSTENIPVNVFEEHTEKPRLPPSQSVTETTESIILDTTLISNIPEKTTSSEKTEMVYEKESTQVHSQYTTVPTTEKDESDRHKVSTQHPAIDEEVSVETTLKDTEMSSLKPTFATTIKYEDTEDISTIGYQDITTGRSTENVLNIDTETKLSSSVDETKTTQIDKEYEDVTKQTTMISPTSGFETTETMQEISTEDNIKKDQDKQTTFETTSELSGNERITTESIEEYKPEISVTVKVDEDHSTIAQTEKPVKLPEDTPVSTSSEKQLSEESYTSTMIYDNTELPPHKTEESETVSDSKTTVADIVDKEPLEPYTPAQGDDMIKIETTTLPETSDSAQKEHFTPYLISSTEPTVTISDAFEVKDKETEQPLSMVTQKETEIPFIPDSQTEHSVESEMEKDISVTPHAETFVTEGLDVRTTVDMASSEDGMSLKTTIASESFSTRKDDLSSEIVTQTSMPGTHLDHSDVTTQLPRETSDSNVEETTPYLIASEQPHTEEIPTKQEHEEIITTSKPSIIEFTTLSESLSTSNTQAVTEIPEISFDKANTETSDNMDQTKLSDAGEQSTEVQIPDKSSTTLLPETQTVTKHPSVPDEDTQTTVLPLVDKDIDLTKEEEQLTEPPSRTTSSEEKETTDLEKEPIDLQSLTTRSPFISETTTLAKVEESETTQGAVDVTQEEKFTPEVEVTTLSEPDATKEAQEDKDVVTVQPLSSTEIQTDIPQGLDKNTDDDVLMSTQGMTSTEQNILNKLETTSEAKYDHSETTPYIVELEEHTHQTIPETTDILEQGTTTQNIIDIALTERGDQITEKVDTETETEKIQEITEAPIELVTSKSTEENMYQTTAAKEEIEIMTSTEGHIEVKPDEDLSKATTTSHNIQNEESATTSPSEKPSVIEAEVTITTEKSDQKLDEETRKPEILPSDEERKTTPATVYEELATTSSKTSLIDEKVEEIPSTSMKPMTTKPDYHFTEEIPSPEFPPSGVSGYGQEPDYGEEDQAFGPGTCRYGGKVYVSAQQIPRDDPCDFCFCFRSDIICLQQSCPPPIHGCHEEPIQGFCCPRYECPVSMATTLNVTTTTTTTTTTLPPHFLPHAYKGAAQRRGCHIKGHTYKVGEVVRASSGPCLHCTCGGDGQMKCDPKVCTPEPMLRQMIAAAVSDRRRR